MSPQTLPAIGIAWKRGSPTSKRTGTLGGVSSIQSRRQSAQDQSQPVPSVRFFLNKASWQIWKMSISNAPGEGAGAAALVSLGVVVSTRGVYHPDRAGGWPA